MVMEYELTLLTDKISVDHRKGIKYPTKANEITKMYVNDRNKNETQGSNVSW